jgi:hypothetical protein
VIPICVSVAIFSSKRLLAKYTLADRITRRGFRVAPVGQQDVTKLFTDRKLGRHFGSDGA